MPDLPLHLWYAITTFGGAGLTLPLAFAIAFWLAFGYSWRMAFGWLLLLCAGIGVVTVTKLAFLGWGIGVRVWDFTGVSGHSMLSTSVYPVALFLMLLPARPSLRALGVALGLAIGIAVGLSRVALNAHSPSEAIAGCVVGAATALVFVGWSWRLPPGRLAALPVVLSLAVLAWALHDVRVPTQRWVTDIALMMSGHERPYVRARWKAGYYDTPRPDAPALPMQPMRSMRQTRNLVAPIDPATS